MKRHALIVILLGAIALLVAALAPPGRAAAQPQPTLVISPASGPCDAAVEVKGSGFEPGSEVPLDLAGPHSDVAIGRLAVATAAPDGGFSVQATFGPLGCEAAARDTEVARPGEPRDLGVFAGHDPTRLFVMAGADYHYTTTTSSIARVLPPAGDGSGVQRGSGATAVIAGLAGVGALLLTAGVWARATASKIRRRRC